MNNTPDDWYNNKVTSDQWQMSGKKVPVCQRLYTVTEPVIICVIPCAAETSGIYDPVPGFQEPNLSSQQYTAIYDYEAQVSPFTAVWNPRWCFHSRWQICVLSSERGWALLILRGRRGRCGSGRGWLVDGPKERKHWTSSRLLPRQRMTVFWTPGLCQTSTEALTAALLLPFLGSNTLAPFKCSCFCPVWVLKLLVHNFNV